MPNAKYYIYTFGCQMNKSDSERIAGLLESIGYKATLREKEADLIVVNACSVRQSAIDRVYGLAENLKQLQAKNHKLITILTGCVISRDRQKLEGRFDYLLNIKDLASWPKSLGLSSRKNNQNYLEIMPRCRSSFSAFVPIMTGCNNFCAYCVVPYSRGKEVSRPAKEIISEIKCLINNGYKEIWLLGQNVNSYKDKEIDFPQLIRMVNNLNGDFWIRFTSSHPKDFSDELIKAISDCSKVTNYLNLPLQAGDNTVLKRMNRPYTVKHYEGIIRKLRRLVPDICLSTDIIVGFPKETKVQFTNTRNLFQRISYDMAYIAEYSVRPGTAAAKMKDDVPAKEKTRRFRVLNSILKKTGLAKNKRYLGKTVVVLPEEEHEGLLVGKSREYKTVKFNGPKELIGQFVKVKITRALPWGLTGKRQ